MPTPILNRIAACCLALLLLFGGTAKEALHAFAQHEDTEHRHTDGLSFEAEHHHCDALSAFITAFESPVEESFRAAILLENAPLFAEVVRSLLPRKVQAYGLRGPPIG